VQEPLSVDSRLCCYRQALAKRELKYLIRTSVVTSPFDIPRFR
jgi:hypothetical protein